MRQRPFRAVFALATGLGLSLGPALAQTRPGWVDPPAKSGTDLPAKPATEAPAARPPESTPGGGLAAGELAASEPAPSEPAPRARATRRGAEPRESPVATRPEPRRLARVPATRIQTTRMPAASGVSDPRFPEWAGRAQRLADDYVDSTSAPSDAMVAAATQFYGERVRFHGRVLSLAALIAEKRRFARRWPERRYAVQGGSTRTACNAASATCLVRTTLDYRAENSARGARSQGVAELVLEVSFAGSRPVIVSESSRVLRRYAPGSVSALPALERGA